MTRQHLFGRDLLDHPRSSIFDLGLTLGLILALALYAPVYVVLAGLVRLARADGGDAKPWQGLRAATRPLRLRPRGA